jgi:hypothetical protein
MVFQISMQKRVADIFDTALLNSMERQIERYSLCLYNPYKHRIVEAIPPEHFERQGLIGLENKKSFPAESLLHHIKLFNRGIVQRIHMISYAYGRTNNYDFSCKDGVFVPYRTRPGNASMFPDQGWIGDDNFKAFHEDLMYLDIVVSEDAWRRGIDPPLCAAFNPIMLKYDEQNIHYFDKGNAEIEELDRKAGIEPGTHLDLWLQQRGTMRHMTIDFIVD